MFPTRSNRTVEGSDRQWDPDTPLRAQTLVLDTRYHRKEHFMTSDLRWRIVSLQAILILVFAFLAGFCFWGANFTHTNVKDQLVAQKINFAPAAAISPKEYSPSARANLLKYAGQPVDTGVKAQVYANDFIGT